MDAGVLIENQQNASLARFFWHDRYSCAYQSKSSNIEQPHSYFVGAVVLEAAEPNGPVQLARTYFFSSGGAATRVRAYDWDGNEEEVRLEINAAFCCLSLFVFCFVLKMLLGEARKEISTLFFFSLCLVLSFSVHACVPLFTPLLLQSFTCLLLAADSDALKPNDEAYLTHDQQPSPSS